MSLSTLRVLLQALLAGKTKCVVRVRCTADAAIPSAVCHDNFTHLIWASVHSVTRAPGCRVLSSALWQRQSEGSERKRFDKCELVGHFWSSHHKRGEKEPKKHKTQLVSNGEKKNIVWHNRSFPELSDALISPPFHLRRLKIIDFKLNNYNF